MSPIHLNLRMAFDFILHDTLINQEEKYSLNQYFSNYVLWPKGYHEKVPRRSQNLQLYFFSIVPEPEEAPIYRKENSKNPREDTTHSHTPQKPLLPDFLQLWQTHPSLGLATESQCEKHPSFYEFIWAKPMIFAGEQNLKSWREKQFCSFFSAFETKEGM